MVKHVVCFKLRDNSPSECEKARDVLLSMRGKVPALLEIEVAVADKAALEAYQKDPYHCEVVKKHMHAVAESSVAVDWEV